MTPRDPAAVTGLAAGPRRSPAPVTPLGRYLTDPGAVTARAVRVLLEAGRHHGPVAGPLLAAALAAVVLARRQLRRRQHAALAAGARAITVLAPPLADPVQDVAQRGEGVHAQPLRWLGDQPENLLARQVDVAFGQQRHQVRGVVEPRSAIFSRRCQGVSARSGARLLACDFFHVDTIFLKRLYVPTGC